MSLAAVNLLWQHRYRGLLPVSEHFLDDHGNALLIRPDELERRTYQLLSVSPDGTAMERGAIAVETIHKFVGTADASLLLGMTSEAIYIFREGRKVRFMPDRRVLHADVTLAPAPGWFVCAFSDSLFSTHGIAFGDISGRVGWVKDLESAVSRVALAGDGHSLVLGGPDGKLLALDQMRRTLWEREEGEAITALAMPAVGPMPVVGTEIGTVSALDSDGGRRWRTPVGIPVIAVATDKQAQWAAAVLSDGATHLLVCFGPDGNLLWEYELEAKPTGISLSPEGRYLLVSLTTGTAYLFEADFAASAALTSGGRRDEGLAQAQHALASGSPEHARELLDLVVSASPHDLAVAELLMEAEAAIVQRRREEAIAEMERGRYRSALELLDVAFKADPWNLALFQQRAECRERSICALRSQAGEQEEGGEWEAASRTWRQVLSLDPHCTDARVALQRIREAEADALVRQGDQRRESGDLEAALELWRRARELSASAEVEARVKEAHVHQCLAKGIALYEAQRLPEAIFQLKKVLALDPDNSDARRYLGYASGQTGDTLVADRFAHLE